MRSKIRKVRRHHMMGAISWYEYFNQIAGIYLENGKRMKISPRHSFALEISRDYEDRIDYLAQASMLDELIKHCQKVNSFAKETHVVISGKTSDGKVCYSATTQKNAEEKGYVVVWPKGKE